MNDEPQAPKLILECPCGEVLTARDEDAIVAAANEHLLTRHPGMSYTREQILFLTYPA